MMVDYAIELDGKITINNVYPTPENKFLEQQVKERLSIDTPQLSPDTIRSTMDEWIRK